MLTKLIVDVYVWIIEISLWFMLVVSGVTGYHYAVPVLKAAGWILENETTWKIYGALFFVVATFLVSAILTGPFLVLVDIRKSVRAFETNNSGGSSGGSGSRVLPFERREPSLGKGGQPAVAPQRQQSASPPVAVR